MAHKFQPQEWQHHLAEHTMNPGVPGAGARGQCIFVNFMMKSEAFPGLVQQGLALVDTGAQYGVSGTAAFEKLEDQIQKT